MLAIVCSYWAAVAILGCVPNAIIVGGETAANATVLPDRWRQQWFAVAPLERMKSCTEKLSCGPQLMLTLEACKMMWSSGMVRARVLGHCHGHRALNKHMHCMHTMRQDASGPAMLKGDNCTPCFTALTLFSSSDKWHDEYCGSAQSTLELFGCL